MKLIERVLDAAEPHMKGKGLRVVDGVIGISFIGLKLSNGRCHFIYPVSYTHLDVYKRQAY